MQALAAGRLWSLRSVVSRQQLPSRALISTLLGNGPKRRGKQSTGEPNRARGVGVAIGSMIKCIPVRDIAVCRIPPSSIRFLLAKKPEEVNRLCEDAPPAGRSDGQGARHHHPTAAHREPKAKSAGTMTARGPEPFLIRAYGSSFGRNAGLMIAITWTMAATAWTSVRKLITTVSHHIC